MKEPVGRTGQSALPPREGQGRKKEAPDPGREGALIRRRQSRVTQPHGETGGQRIGNGRSGQERDQANTVSSGPFCQPQSGTAAPCTNDETEAEAGPRFACSPPQEVAGPRLTPGAPAPPPHSRPQCCVVSGTATCGALHGLRGK